MLEKATVLARSKNKTDLAILEVFLIKQHKPAINKQVKKFLAYLKNILISLRILHTRTNQKNVHVPAKSTCVFKTYKIRKVENMRNIFK